jgi:GNAT superfamily N-acetyltransferase
VAPEYEVRLARPGEVAALPAIERAAARLFPSAGIEGAFLDDARSPDELACAQREARLFVAALPGGPPVGFALAVTYAGVPHLEELDVHPDHGQRGLGTALVRAVVGWARARGGRSLTLSTFRDVPWNAPFYARLGFRALAESELGPALRALREREVALGLPVGRRVCMRLELDARR